MSDWIHCPDNEKRGRIAREMREFRASLFQERPPPRQRHQHERRLEGLSIKLSLNMPFPWVRWETLA